MRKTAIIVIDAPGRDSGKAFFIRELPASQAEMWAAKAFLAMARSGVDVPDHIAAEGLAGLATFGLRALSGMRFEDAQSLLAEMFTCVQIIPDLSRPNVIRGLLEGGSEEDIEEVSTRLRLRKEVFGLHVDFSLAGVLLNSVSAPAVQAGQGPTT